ncbi:hypothetical protein [Tsukamurella soli]|uniref:Membrane protein n=1 Tax=Tsukamurella soli TaxID=644556 RepID=A0ABP8JTF4_9ACTN
MHLAGPVRHRPAPVGLRVAAPSATYWCVAALLGVATETATPMLLRWSHPGAALVTLGALVVTLALQLHTRRCVTPLHWLAFAAAALTGTVLAHGAHAWLPSTVTTAGFASALAVWLAIWASTHGSAAIGSVTTRVREVFYWGAVVLASSLGAAAADWLVHQAGLGAKVTAALGIVGVVATALTVRARRIPPAAAAWLAFVTLRTAASAVGGVLAGIGADAAAVAAAALGAAALITLGAWAYEAITAHPGHTSRHARPSGRLAHAH